MAPFLEAALDAVRRPGAITPDPIRGRWRYWCSTTGPSRWLFVVVDWDESAPCVVTAYAKRRFTLR
jgi:hypothetical protein